MKITIGYLFAIAALFAPAAYSDQASVLINPLFATAKCAGGSGPVNTTVRVIYNDGSGENILYSDNRGNGPKCRALAAKLNAIILSGKSSNKWIKFNLENAYESVVADPPMNPILRPAAGKFSCEFKATELMPSLALNAKGCGQQLFTSPALCRDELGGEITTSVVCSMNGNTPPDPTACYNEFIGSKLPDNQQPQPGQGDATNTGDAS